MFLKKFSSVKKRLTSLFKRNREVKLKITPWGEEIEAKKSLNPASFKVYLIDTLGFWRQKTSIIFHPPTTKIHVKFLLKGKRYFTVGLCFIYLIVSFFALPNPISLLFFATFFILLDYLWKTRLMKWSQEE